MMDKKIEQVKDLVVEYGGIDGAHHKQWLISEILRTLLTKTEYKAFKKEYEGDPEDEDNYYGEWDEGIAP